MPANTGVAAPLVYPIWGIIQSVVNQAVSNYNSWTAVMEKRMSNGLQFQASYVLTRDLSDAGGAVPTEFAPERAATGFRTRTIRGWTMAM